MTDSAAPPVLEVRGVTKSFAGVRALRDVSLRVGAGEVLCLLGDNGAGKSTLIKVMSGVHAPTRGTLAMDGQPVSFRTPAEALARGIATVHQTGGTVPLMSVSRNFFLGVEPTRGWGPLRRMNLHEAGRIALEQLHALGISRVRDPNQLMGTLSGGERQAFSIARAMYFGARVLILDEPTSALGVKEAAKVIRLIARARANGVCVVFITHNAHHALSVGDRFTVLIQGAVAAEFSKGTKRREEVLNLMAGGEGAESLQAELEQLDVDLGGEAARASPLPAGDTAASSR